MSRSALSLVLFTALTAAGCGSSPAGSNNAVTMPDLAMSPPDLAFDPGPYPSGPFGTKTGSVLRDIVGKGYLLTKDQTDATQLKLESIAIDVVRARAECKCLILSQSATWCGPCNAEQSELVDAVNTKSGLCVFNVLVDGPVAGTRATSDDVLNWNIAHSQNFPVIGANINTYANLPTPQYLPTNVVINPSTMEILDINYGLGPTTIDDALALCQN